MSESAEKQNEGTPIEGEEKEVDTGVEESGEASNDDIEERARTMGWVPEEEFRGDKSRWVDAETFVERGENELPILKERYRHLSDEFREMKKTLKQFADHHKKVSEREYKNALEAIKAQKAEAVSLGDADAYKKAETQEEQLRNYKPETIEVADDSGEHPDFRPWVEENQWYLNDKRAHALADTIAEELAKDRPDLQGRAFFDAVKAQVKQEMPHKFDNPKRNAPAAVEGPSGVRRSGKKGYAELPSEAKAACDKFVKQGLLTKEQYVSEFFGEQK